MWSNIFFRPEEAMLETGKIMSTELKFSSVLEKITL